ncbi:MAG: signal peptidase, partial [Actinomycetota bacterium]
MTEAAGTVEPAASGTAGLAASGTADNAEGSETFPDVPADAPVGAVGIAYALASAIVVLDQATKTLVLDVLTPGRFVPWLGGGVGWQLVLNPGGAFGLPAPHWLFLAVTVVVVVVVARSLPRVPTLLHAAAYGLLLAGALGNAIDRLVRAGGPGFGRGYVVDFVAWGGFP